MKNKNKKKVIIAMSGGIDSSVAAALLKKQGYNVIGVFMRFWSQEGRDCFLESEKRARSAAGKIGIPFYVFNLEKKFKKKVVDCFLKSSKSGLTPNPCVVCNKEIKFGLLFKKLKSLNADYIATGHYARIKTQNSKLKTQNHNLKLKTFKLLKGRDKNKDQSYFLWKLDQKILRKTLFPVGDYAKPEIRRLAKKFKLFPGHVPESQEICFVKNNINDFLKKYLKTKPGLIINRKEKVLGRHQGLWFYTIGQRKGIGLAGGPYYVLDKDIKRNLLIATNNKKDLDKKELFVKNLNWISGKAPKFPLKVRVKIRSQHKPASALLVNNICVKPGLTQSKVRFNKPQRAVTSGQSAVFYEKNELLGGGVII